MKREAIAITLSCAALGAFAWPKGTQQKNLYTLPPASEQVRAEAVAAKARLADKVKITNIVGHRGDSEEIPENTAPAFKAAVDKGFNFETDLYVTLDGVVFATHDFRLRRKNSGVDAYSTNVTWKGQLENADAGAWMGEKWKGTKYPTIDDVLSFAGDGRFIILEIKDPRKEKLLPLVKDALARHPNANATNVVFQGGRGWLAKNLPGYRDVACGLPRKGWKIDDPPHDLSWAARLDPKQFRAVSLRWDEELITKELVDAVHARGIQFIVWTVNDAPSAWAALGRGVDYICTDRPSALWAEMTAK